MDDRAREFEAAVARRLDTLERENDRLKRRSTAAVATAGALLGLSVILLGVALTRGLGGGVADAVEARRFVLRDETGLQRGFFEVGERNTVRLVLRDTDGRERMRLALLPDGSPGLTLGDREGRPRAILGVLPDETSNLVFADAQGKTRAVLGLSANQSGTLVFADRAGDTRAAMGVDVRGAPELTLYEQVAAPTAPAMAVPAPDSAGEANGAAPDSTP